MPEAGAILSLVHKCRSSRNWIWTTCFLWWQCLRGSDPSGWRAYILLLSHLLWRPLSLRSSPGCLMKWGKGSHPLISQHFTICASACVWQGKLQKDAFNFCFFITNLERDSIYFFHVILGDSMSQPFAMDKIAWYKSSTWVQRRNLIQ